MEILLNLDVCEDLACAETYNISDSDKERIKEKLGIDNIEKVEFVDIGPGISIMTVLIIISLGIHTIKMGSEINDGIEGWIKIGKKLKRLFSRKKIVSIDMEGATALAIEHIAKQKNVVSLEKMQETVVNLADFTGLLPENKGLSQKPYNYYIQVYRINGDDIYVIGIRSDGEVKTIKHFSLNSYGITEADKNL